jgi:molybdate transport system substrate-binding protein
VSDRRRPPWAVAIAVACVVAACTTGAGGSSPPAGASPAPSGTAASSPTGELTVFSAASLRGALEQAKMAYEAANPGVSITLATDSSSALETQIEQGAPADVFLSADTTNAEKLVERGFASGAPTVFAGNKLTVIVPSDNPGGLSTPADLARPGLKVIAAGDEVPITRYAKQLVVNLAKEPGYPATLVDAYDANVVSREDNVKAIVAKIELGEGDAGIVYVTDAAASDKVKALDVPDAADVHAAYAGIVVKASENEDAAAKFLSWLAGPEGQAILSSFGFLPPAS